MSSPKRFFASIDGDEGIISGEEYIHAVSVMRLKVGDIVELINNTKWQFLGTVSEITKRQVLVKITQNTQNFNENEHFTLLICGFLKGDKTELIVQKATELGVQKIVVFESQNSSAYLSASKIDRLIKVAKEAAKQCRRSVYPEIISEKTLKDALSHGAACHTKLFCFEEANSTSVKLSTKLLDTAIVCGSEGGFTHQEFDLAKSLGYSAVWLGGRILRAETAAITMCAVVNLLNGEFEKQQ